MQVETRTVEKNPANGTIHEISVSKGIPSRTEKMKNYRERLIGWVWYIAGVLDVLVVLRLLFLMFGAADQGFAHWLYVITGPLVSPFTGIFTSSPVDGGYLESSSMLAIVMYSIAAWFVSSLIEHTLE